MQVNWRLCTRLMNIHNKGRMLEICNKAGRQLRSGFLKVQSPYIRFPYDGPKT